MHSGNSRSLLNPVLVLGVGLLVSPVRNVVMRGSSATHGQKPAIGPTTYLAVLPFRAVGDDPRLRSSVGAACAATVDSLSARWLLARGRRQPLDIRQLRTDRIRVRHPRRKFQIIPKFIGRGGVFSASCED
jgi:hypothetical protein